MLGGLKTLCAEKTTFPVIRKVALSPLVCQLIKEQIKMIHYSFCLKYWLSLHAQVNVLERLGARAPEELLMDQQGPTVGLVSAQPG